MKNILTLFVILLASVAWSQSITVHDDINHSNTTINCSSNGNCSVYDQDNQDARRSLNKQAVDYCRTNHISWHVSKKDPAAFPGLDGLNRYASESCWEAYQKTTVTK